jgi:hypothetical protein
MALDMTIDCASHMLGPNVPGTWSVPRSFARCTS